MDNPVKIKSIQHLVTILDNSQYVREFFIALNGGGRSWKRMTHDDKLDRYGRNKIEIVNEIDETKQVLAVANLGNSKYSNIPSAIRCGAFYLYDCNENDDKFDVQFYN